jgi:four helix bundle protein
MRNQKTEYRSQNNRGTAKNFQELVVWQKAHQLVLSIYSFSSKFPQAEMYGLTSQVRRAIVSVPANIAEGFKKKGKNDKVRFFNIAQGSLEECGYYIILAKDLGYGENREISALLEEVSRMLTSYIKSILNSSS